MPDSEGDETDLLLQRIAVLRAEHKTLDEQIHRLVRSSPCNLLEAGRLKKRKLALKDLIRNLETQLPDIIA